jgi:hypothetical protein
MKVRELVYGLHSDHVASEHTSNVRFIHDLAVMLNWNYTLVYKIGQYHVAFVPSSCMRPISYLESEYCLGSLYYGSYYLLTPQQVVAQNLGYNTVVLSDDYLGYKPIEEQLIFYALFL